MSRSTSRCLAVSSVVRSPLAASAASTRFAMCAVKYALPCSTS